MTNSTRGILNDAKGNLIRLAQEADANRRLYLSHYEKNGSLGAQRMMEFHRGQQRAYEKAISEVDFAARRFDGRIDQVHPKVRDIEFRATDNFEDRLA